MQNVVKLQYKFENLSDTLWLWFSVSIPWSNCGNENQTLVNDSSETDSRLTDWRTIQNFDGGHVIFSELCKNNTDSRSWSQTSHSKINEWPINQRQININPCTKRSIVEIHVEDQQTRSNFEIFIWIVPFLDTCFGIILHLWSSFRILWDNLANLFLLGV